MGDSFVATVQYGDMKGTVAIDGHDGGPLEGDLIAHVKQGFLPIGFGLYRLDTDENGDLPFVVYAVEAELVGETAKEINSYASEHGKLPVVGFHGKILASEFGKFFKRFSLCAQSRSIDLGPEDIDIVRSDYGEDDSTS